MIDHFSKEQFEAALPKHKETGANLWRYAGMDKGEHCYFLNFDHKYAEIFIRSSVKRDGHSAETGKDSIRIWLCEPGKQLPLAKKLSAYITRVKGWETRLLAQLRTLARMGKKIGLCFNCQATLRIVEIKKGENAGKYALTCPTMVDGKYANHIFKVIEEEENENPS